jgi:Fe2+ or Zn2+ uptake regulation protein
MTKPLQPHQSSIDEMFAARGIPLTRQRRAIWEYFSTAGRASTVAEAADVLRSDGIGQATVYRTVGLLTELGLLLRVHVDGDAPCYTALPVGHTHPLICGVCHRIVDFDGEGDLRYLEKQLEATTGFAIYGHILEVYGVCPQCRAAEAKDGSSQAR